MDKQAIEKLRKDLCNGYCGYETCGDCYGENDNYIGCTGMAERLYNVGYRKIPKNSVVVVLKKEQYTDKDGNKTILVSNLQELFAKEYRFELAQTRKETAKEIFQDIDERLPYLLDLHHAPQEIKDWFSFHWKYIKNSFTIKYGIEVKK